MQSNVTFLTTVAVAAFRRARHMYATAVIEDPQPTDEEADRVIDPPPPQDATRGTTPDA